MLRFVERMTVPRSGAPLDGFSHLLSPADAAALFGGRFVHRGDPLRAHTWLEYLSDADADRPGFDAGFKGYLDADRDLPPGLDGSLDLVAAFEAETRWRADAVLALLKASVSAADGLHYVMARRHGFVAHKGVFKLSTRVFFLGLRFASHALLPRLLARLAPGPGRGAWNPVLAETREPFWDESVYKPRDQLMAALGGLKSAEDRRRLLPVRGYDAESDDDALRFAIQHVDAAWPLLDAADLDRLPPLQPMTPHAAARCPSARCVPMPVAVRGGLAAYADAAANNKAHEEPVPVPVPEPLPRPEAPEGPKATASEDDDDEIAALVACLGEATAAPRDDWIAVGILLKVHDHGGPKHFGAWVDFSRKCARKFPGAAECRRQWDSLRALQPGDVVGKKPLTVATLHHWAMRDDPAAYAALCERFPATAPGNSGRVLVDFGGAPSPRGGPCGGPLQAVDKAALISSVKALERCAASLERMDVDNTTLAVADGRLRLSCADAPGAAHVAVASDFSVRHGDDFVGSLVRDAPVDANIGFVHRSIRSEAFSVTRESLSKTVFTAPEPQQSTVTLHNHGDAGTASVKVCVPGAADHTLTAKSIIARLGKIYDASAASFAKARFGLTQNVFNVAGDQIINVFAPSDDNGVRADDELAATWGAFLANADADEAGTHRIVKTDDAYFYFDEAKRKWHRTTSVDMVCNRMLHAMKTANGGSFFYALTDAEKRYVGGIRGGTNVLRRSALAMFDPDFETTLDANVALLPFDNGVFELSTGVFRETAWSDYVATSVGYPYVSAGETPPAHVELVRRFLAQVLPVDAERELVLRMAGSSLAGMPRNKKFLVLQDFRGGDNGKTMFMRAIEAAMCNFCMPGQASFLAVSSHTNPNGHEANTLAYKGKRVALFDETDPDMRFDIAKLKSITGGAPKMAVRGAHAATVTKFQWSAFVMIACNKGCLPRLDSTDAAFVNRLVTVPMRAKFNDAAAAAGVELAYPCDLRITEKLQAARMAVMHELLAGYARYRDAGETFGDLPPGCIALRTAVLASSDPLAEAVEGLIMQRVTFDLERTEELRGRRVLGFVARDELTRLIRAMPQFAHTKASLIKQVVDAAMAARGRPLVADTVLVGAGRQYNVYLNCGLN